MKVHASKGFTKVQKILLRIYNNTHVFNAKTFVNNIKLWLKNIF